MIIVDGKSDQKVAECIKRFSNNTNRNFEGRITVLCLASTNERRAKSQFSLMLKKKNTVVYVIADTDTFARPDQFNNFIRNIKILKADNKVKEVRTILQHNLESELCDSLKMKERDLFTLFGSGSKTEFTNNILKHDTKNIYNKIKKAEENFFWSNYHNGYIAKEKRTLEEQLGNISFTVFD